MAHKLYVHKVCPYAHRSFLTAELRGLLGTGAIELVEVSLPTPTWYNETVNPRATVPALSLPGTDDKPGAVVPESLIVTQYIDEAFPPVEGAAIASLLTPAGATAKQKADVRLFVTEADNAIPGLYKCLVNAKNATAFEGLFKSAKEDLAFLEGLFAATAAERGVADGSDGPFFLGAQISLADVALAPFLHRFQHTLKAYAGLPQLLEGQPRIEKMLRAVEALPAFQATKLPADEFVKLYSGYVKEAPAAEA